MYRKILVPVDLTHKEKLSKALDTAVELDDRLLDAIKDTGADLVVMASHPPGIGDRLHILHSNGANIVKHSDVSVFIIR